MKRHRFRVRKANNGTYIIEVSHWYGWSDIGTDYGTQRAAIAELPAVTDRYIRLQEKPKIREYVGYLNPLDDLVHLDEAGVLVKKKIASINSIYEKETT